MSNYLFFIVFILSIGVQARPWIALFGSKECSECAELKQEWCQDFNRPEDPVLVFLPIEHTPNYRCLGELEAVLKVSDKASTFPVMLLGTRFVSDIEEFWKLEEQFGELAAQAPQCRETQEIIQAAEGAKGPMITLELKGEAAQQVSVAKTESSVRLAFFHQPNCKKCSRQNHELALLQEQKPGLVVDSFDVTTQDGQAMLSRAKRRFHLESGAKNLAPMVCWSDGYVTGRLALANEIAEGLDKAIGENFWEAPLDEAELRSLKQEQHETLDAFLLPSVVASGFADGINPCAFATSIFLISYLLMCKRRRRDIALIGFSFCLGVFGAYLLFGLGISFIIDALNRFAWIKKGLYILFAGISAVLALAHARDAWIVKRGGKVSDMDMGLSKETHRKIHEKIRSLTASSSWLLVPAALVLGTVVSSMELACTGQIYLPVLVAINRSGASWKSFSYLIVYNVCFIIPLLVVTVLALCGTGTRGVAEWARKNVFGTKLVMAVVFAVIAVIMVAVAFGDELHLEAIKKLFFT